jgi:predicted ATP-binding protein involved in virulence
MANTEHKHFIKSFEIKNFRGIIDSGKVDIPEDTQWIFLTGENGFGKTSVLQALAAGLYGKENVNALTYEEKKQAQISISLPIKVKPYIGNSGQNFDQLIAYGANRLKRDAKSSNLPTDSLFNKETSFLYIEDVLMKFINQIHKAIENIEKIKDEKEKQKEEKNRKKYEKAFQNLEAIFCKIIPDLEQIIISENSDETVVYKENFSEKPIQFNELSTGFRSWITIIGDILKRHYKINQVQFNTSKIRLIIFIDEFDLHLHPKWQRELPAILTEIFPNVQFVVSTHSPIPLLGAPKNSAFLKVTRNSEEGIKIENLDYVEVRNLTPNTILTSPIFDFEDFIPENDNDFLNLSVEDLYKDEVFYQILDKKLEKLSKEDENLLDELLK